MFGTAQVGREPARAAAAIEAAVAEGRLAATLAVDEIAAMIEI